MRTGPDSELFGLAGTFPHPGSVVLDAARDHRFTGEIVFEVAPPVHVYFDRGDVYLAERSTEPPLGTRLIDAGALNAAQLEHGSLWIGETAHLGRLFDRVPSIDRDVVVLMTEMMNDECVAWIASLDVDSVTSTPYRHHASGIHRWRRAADDADLRPGDPLPAPPPSALPVDAVLPTADPHADTDPLVAWGEPGTNASVAPAFAPPDPSGHVPEQPAEQPAGDSILESDWVDRLETHGLPEIGSDPLAVPTALPAVPTGQPDRFELIWPSGEIDAEFDAGAALDHLHERDHDRAGPTARVVRATDAGSDQDDTDGEDSLDLWNFETTAPSFGPTDATRPAAPTGDDPADQGPADPEPHLTMITDDAVQSMRRAVETIEADALAEQPAARLADTSTTAESVRADDLVLPGRVATRTESSAWCIRGFDNTTNCSVFDDAVVSSPRPKPAPQPAAVTANPDHGGAVAVAEPAVADEPARPVDAPRVSALRRLIGGLRFR